MAAVVDQISYPAPEDLKEAQLKTGSVPYCSEGVSLIVGLSDILAPNLWSSLESLGEREKWSTEQHCSLFIQLGRTDNEVHRTKRKLTEQGNYRKLLEVPVANTIFQNGQKSTFFAQRWMLKAGPGLKPDLRCVKHRGLQQQRVQIPIRQNWLETSFHLPQTYFPLTSPQTVATCMGNIISQFEKAGDPGVTEPASLQLENAISSIQSLQKAPQDVWARVIPQEFWPDRPHMLPILADAFQHGHRFHRVLSGGGGWGNKRGLLSLDPDPTFSEYRSELGPPHEPQDYVEAEARDMLGEIVRPGDVVDLWGRSSVEPRLEPTKRYPRSSCPMLISRSDLSFCFGSASEEMMPKTNTRDDRAKIRSEYLVFEQHFGAISNSGMSLHIKSYSPTGTFGSLKLGTILQSKIPSGGCFRNSLRRNVLSCRSMESTTSSAMSPELESEALQTSSLPQRPSNVANPRPHPQKADQTGRQMTIPRQTKNSADQASPIRKIAITYREEDRRKYQNLGILRPFRAGGDSNLDSVPRRPRRLFRKILKVNSKDRLLDESGNSALARELRANPQLRLDDALKALSLPEIGKKESQEPWTQSYKSSLEPADSPSELQQSPSLQKDSSGGGMESSSEPGTSAKSPSESAPELQTYLHAVSAEKDAYMGESEEYYERGNF